MLSYTKAFSIDKESTFGLRFRQMLSASKAIRIAYVN
jgi:hypothetical protein